MYQIEFYEKRNGVSDVWDFLENYADGQYVLLHHFRKKSQKTPPRELARAKEAWNDYLRQKKERIK